MNPVVLGAAVGGTTLGLVLLLARWPRTRPAAALVLSAGLGTATWTGFFDPTLLGPAPPWRAWAALIAWAAWGTAWMRWGDHLVRGRGPLLAPMWGALLGDLPAAALLARREPDPAARARVALAAAAGGLVSPLGTAAVILGASPRLLLGPALAGWALALLPSRPANPRPPPPLPTWRRWGGACAGWLVVALAAGVARATGSLAELGLGLAELQTILGRDARPCALAAGMAAAALAGEGSAALAASALLAVGGGPAHLSSALLAGAALGGTGPLRVAGALRSGVTRHVLWLLVVLTWSALGT